MQIRRPIAAVMTALALFGGGVTMTACDAAGAGQRDGTTDTGGESGEEAGQNLPNNSDPENESEDQSDDQQDPD